MSESKSHKDAKTRGLKNAKTEVPISRNRRLDASTRDVAREVERSGNKNLIAKAVSRLETQASKKKELAVPMKHLEMAETVIKKAAKSDITLRNLSGTHKEVVKKRR